LAYICLVFVDYQPFGIKLMKQALLLLTNFPTLWKLFTTLSTSSNCDAFIKLWYM